MSHGEKYRVTPFNLPILLKVLYVTLKLKPKSFGALIKLIKHIGSRELAMKKGKGGKGFYIYDEGSFKTAAFAINNFSKIDNICDFLDVYFKYLRIPDILIILEADSDVILNCRKKRNSAHEILNQSQIEHRINENETEQILNFVDSKVNTLILNHNDGMLTKNAKKIVKFLEQF